MYEGEDMYTFIFYIHLLIYYIYRPVSICCLYILSYFFVSYSLISFIIYYLFLRVFSTTIGELLHLVSRFLACSPRATRKKKKKYHFILVHLRRAATLLFVHYPLNSCPFLKLYPLFLLFLRLRSKSSPSKHHVLFAFIALKTKKVGTRKKKRTEERKKEGKRKRNRKNELKE